MKTPYVAPDDIFSENDDTNLNQKLPSYQRFVVDSEFKKARHKVFSYAIKSLEIKIVDEKLDNVFKNLKCAAETNLAFGFILKT